MATSYWRKKLRGSDTTPVGKTLWISPKKADPILRCDMIMQPVEGPRIAGA